MREQIEQALKEMDFDRNEINVKGSLKTCRFVLTNKSVNKFLDKLTPLIPNNEWLEYPNHKPSDSGWYITTMNGDLNLEYWNITYNRWDNYDKPIIAFKPIPVEPFVKKEKYVEIIESIDNILSRHQSRTQDYVIKERAFLQELITKIENGDLK